MDTYTLLYLKEINNKDQLYTTGILLNVMLQPGREECLGENVHAQSCPTLCNPMDCSPPGSSLWDSPGKNTGVGCHALLQEIFPIQGSNPGLLHCRWILYQLSHQGTPRILEWVDYPFSSGYSQPRNQTGVSCTVGGFFIS